MKVILFNLKKQLNNEDTLAAISCVVLSVTIYFITKIVEYNGAF